MNEENNFVGISTAELAQRCGVAVDTVRMMKRLHGVYRNHRPIKVGNRLRWLPESETQTGEVSEAR